MNINDSSNTDNINIMDYFYNNNDNNEDEEDSESKTYYEHGAHFKYKDLFNCLLKLKKEREKESEIK